MLHIISDFGVGGAGRYLLNLLPGLAAQGVEVAVACPTGGELERELLGGGYQVCPLTDRDLSFSRRSLTEIYSFLSEDSFSIVHTHASMAGRLAARLKGRQVVMTRHSMSRTATNSVWHKAAHRVINRLFTDRIIAVSQAVADDLILRGTDRRQIVVIPNGVPVEVYRAADGAAVRRELSLGDQPLVGMVARLVPDKAPQDFVQAAAMVARRLPEVEFVLVGDGALSAAVEELVEALGLRGRFHLLGYRSDIPAVQAALDIAVLSSHQEGLGLVLLEAMAAGKPVVATEVGGVPEVVLDGVTGRLVAPAQPELLAQALIDLIGQTADAARLGRAGQRRVQEVFSTEVMTVKTLQLYRELTDG